MITYGHPRVLRLREHLFAELYNRATLEHDSQAMLELSFCYNYGFGTRPDWSKCIAYIEKAAKLGNVTAILHLKCINPDLKILERTDFSSNDFSCVEDIFISLMTYCRHLNKKGYYDADRIEDLLRHTDTERFYEGQYCYCLHPEIEELTSPTELLHFTINLIWASLLEEIPLPQEIADNMHDLVQMRDTNGRSMLHWIARCHHPSLPGSSQNIVRLVGEFLISNGSDVNVKDVYGHTPLHAAILSRNASIIDLLLENNCSMEGCYKSLEYCVGQLVGQTACQIVVKLLPFAHRCSEFDIFQLLGYVVSSSYASRRLGLAKEALQYSLEMVDILYRHATDYDINLDEWVKPRLGTMAGMGNVDLLRYFIGKTSKIPRSLSPPIRHHYICLNGIGHIQRDVFLFFLDEMHIDVNDEDEAHLLFPAAQVIGQDAFFFWELIERDADPRVARDGGDAILRALVNDKNGEKAVEFILKTFPDIRICPERPIVCQAACYGYPSTLKAVLNAGANLIEPDMLGLTAIEFAAAYTRPVCLENLKILIFEDQKKYRTAETATRLGKALIRACMQGKLEAARILLEAGADPDFQERPLGQALVRYLQFSANLDSRVRLHAPSEKVRYFAIRELLLKHGDEEYQRKLRAMEKEFFTQTGG